MNNRRAGGVVPAMLRPLVVVLATLLALLTSARADVAVPPPADGEIASLELEQVVDSPCADALAALDPQHELTPAPACTRLERLTVPKLGSIELARVKMNDDFALVLAVHAADTTRAVPIMFTHGGCGAGTCRSDALTSAHVVRLASTDPAFGLEVEVAVHVSHTFRDLGPPRTEREHYRLACTARAHVVDCKQIVLGDSCRVLGWAGTRLRYACTSETELVPARLADVDGIPEADLEAVSELLRELRHVVFDNRDDCARLARQVDALLAREADAATIARSLNTPAGKMPARFTRDFQDALLQLAGARTCLADAGVKDALARLARALGYQTAP